MKVISLLLYVFLSSTAFAQKAVTPIYIGENGPELDACAGTSEVMPVRLNVRSDPSTKNKPIDRIKRGQEVWICDSDTSGQWVGIVYSKTGADCGVATPVHAHQVYEGSCKAGWVSLKLLKPLAG